jgi:hypothetical protein
MRTTAVEFFHAAHEQHLKGRHERGRTRAVQNFGDAYIGEIEVMQAEVAEVGRNKVVEKRLAALVAKKKFVADEHIGGAQLAAGDVGGKSLSLGETSTMAGGH